MGFIAYYLNAILSLLSLGTVLQLSAAWLGLIGGLRLSGKPVPPARSILTVILSFIGILIVKAYILPYDYEIPSLFWVGCIIAIVSSKLILPLNWEEIAGSFWFAIILGAIIGSWGQDCCNNKIIGLYLLAGPLFIGMGWLGLFLGLKISGTKPVMRFTVLIVTISTFIGSIIIEYLFHSGSLAVGFGCNDWAFRPILMFCLIGLANIKLLMDLNWKKTLIAWFFLALSAIMAWLISILCIYLSLSMAMI